MERKKPNIARNAMGSTIAGMRVQHVKTTWDALTKFRLYGSLKAVLQP